MLYAGFGQHIDRTLQRLFGTLLLQHAYIGGRHKARNVFRQTWLDVRQFHVDQFVMHRTILNNVFHCTQCIPRTIYGYENVEHDNLLAMYKR
ncbi:hypothetical protein D3C73_1514710 [compost metagenome]